MRENDLIDEESQSDKPEPKVKNPKTNCYIYIDKPSEILFEPCYHSGVCQKCVVELLKQSDACPFCKQKIEKALIINFDEG